MSSPPPLARAHPSTSSVLPHREDAVISHVTVDGSAEATAAYFDYPEPEAFIHHLSAAPPSSPPTSRTSSVSSRRSWWKRPSIYWGIILSSIKMFTLVMQAAPGIEIFNRMACQVIRPDIRIEHVRYPAWRDDPPLIPSPPLPLPMPMPMPMMTLNFVTDELMISGGLGGMINPNQTQPPTKGQLCLKDPRVQETVASLLTVLSVITGTTTLLVSAWWGQRADLWGRTTVISVAAVATLINDVSVITCTYFSQLLPGKAYWWLIPGTVLVGILGGTSGAAAERAYLSDCAEPTSRAAVFAFQTGMAMGGIALAPIVGAQLVRLSGDLLSVFYLSFVVDLILLLLWFFVVPESLSYSTRASNQKQWEEDRRARLEAASQRTATTRLGRFVQMLRANPVIDLFKPLSVLFPTYKDEDDHSLGKNWNMTVLGATFFILCISSAATPFFMQLSQVLWGWGNEMVGYWLSVLGASRAIYLLFIFPPIIRYFKPKPAAIALEGPESQLHPNTTEASSSSNAAGVAPDAEVEVEVPKPPPVPSFDLLVSRISLGLDIIAWFFVGASQTPGHWLLSTAGLAIGSALVPTVMSLALALYPNGDGEAGKLFGAFSVLSSLGAEICGQVIFGTIFKTSVGVFPRLIIVVAGVALFVAFIMLFFIRLPKALGPVPGAA
ncbi:MFS general substrate transporter [Exidia glandulosa HHB12029]|uniref:MFS general substrate transporter n=1 Tax=Exidia glandulosa HHB12029 TaxID=1314781 RepID=A0A166AM78_EXIGL|nr:MFS general substrate transporter [Exidia glandulosa HHB12029]